MIGMIEESRDAQAPDEIEAMTAVEEEDAAQCTLRRASIRAKVQVVPTSSIAESLTHTALIVNVSYLQPLILRHSLYLIRGHTPLLSIGK